MHLLCNVGLLSLLDGRLPVLADFSSLLACLEPLCNGLAVETDLEDEAEALAHDNFLSACK